MSEYSVDALKGFLDYAATKGLLNKSTAGAKKIAVERVFVAADEEESADVRSVDIHHLMSRFINLSGSEFRPESLASYQSRVKSSIEDFIAWKESPIAFRPSKRNASKKAKAQVTASPVVQNSPGKGPSSADIATALTHSLPIPIRPDLIVRVDGIPYNLTQSEAKKIANVVLAMASEG